MSCLFLGSIFYDLISLDDTGPRIEQLKSQAVKAWNVGERVAPRRNSKAALFASSNIRICGVKHPIPHRNPLKRRKLE